ncbi:MAG: sugar-transfer associated ATP-grasp domain-containing protein [Pseudomonadota bacterium]
MADWQRLGYLAGRGWLWMTRAGFPIGLPARGTTAADRRRRAGGRREVRRRWPWLLRPLVWLLMFPGWAWGSWRATRELLEGNPDLARTHGAGVIRATALRTGFAPREVVEYGLMTSKAPPNAWFCEHEMFGIWERLTPPKARWFVANKLAFAQFCADNNLPHARTLAIWNKGTGDVNPAVWHEGIALKPMEANNARGFEAWTREGDTYLRGDDRLSPDALAARGAMLSRDWGVMFAQPLLELHPILAARGLDGMPVARLITGQWPNGRVQLLDAYYSAPLPGKVASNAGYGPKWPVDIMEGRIEQSQSPLLPHDLLPDVPGAALPGWGVAAEAASFGHAMFPHAVPVLGWDVAFATNGPVLLETNTGISFAVPQGTRQQPAGRQAAAELVDAWLQRL